MDSLIKFVNHQKQLIRCDHCQSEIDRRKGYRFFDRKLLCDGCHAGYVVAQRQRERDAKEAKNYIHEG